jgi:predicted Fe-Mo cluster-binding NifX family protein
MKIAITSTGRELSSDVDPRFGRAAYFLMFDTDSLEYEAIENKQNINLPQGAGIQAGKAIVDNQAKALITGNCGPKAFQVLQSAGIDLFLGARGKVIDAINDYKGGKLKQANSANVNGHWV